MVEFYGETLTSRLILGSALYPSPDIFARSVKAGGAEMVTVSLRREGAEERAGQQFWDIVRSLGIRVLPNTAGCHTPREAHQSHKSSDSRMLFSTIRSA